MLERMRASSNDSRHVSTAALAGFVVGTSLTLLTTWLFHKRTRQQENTTTTPSHQQATLPPEIRNEQLSRHTLYFGSTGMEQLQSAHVCIVGLGGVGSHTAHMLARGGIGYLRLVDFDQVTLSSLNRHACAVLQDVGIPKAVCLARYLHQICPDPQFLQVDARVEMYTAESGPALLELPPHTQQWNMVIDAIDDIPTKAALLAHCIQQNIRVVSCMGAGGKADFTRLHCSDLRTAAKDPLATKLRQALKKLIPNDDNYLDDMQVLTIVYNSQKTVVKLADFTPDQVQDGVHKYGAVDGMRIRVLPVLGTMPAIMGQALAAWCLIEIGGKPIQPVTGERVGKNVRHKLLQHVKRREELLTQQVLLVAGLEKLPNPQGCVIDMPSSTPVTVTLGSSAHQITISPTNKIWVGLPVQIDIDDVEYLMEIWRNRCAVTGDRLGTVLHLVRWDLSRPSTCDNLVLMSINALKRFDQPGGKDGLTPLVRQRIESRLATAKTDIYEDT